MQYMDEIILEQMHQQKKQKYSNIHNGPVYIIDDFFNFSDVFLFEKRLQIKLPSDFADMPEEFAKIKYPMEQRPQVIKTNLNTTVNFAFNLFETALETNHIEVAVHDFKNVVKNMHPTSRIFGMQAKDMHNSTLGWFDFSISGLDQPIYTLVAVAVIDNKMLHAIFNCLLQDMEDWKPIVLQVFRSIQDLSKGKANR